jgi:hypothetical protein
MTGRMRSVEIDRILLDGLDVPPDRADRIRRLVTAELSRALSEEGIRPAWEGGRFPRLTAQPLEQGAVHDDRSLASGLARNIARTLAGSKKDGK